MWVFSFGPSKRKTNLIGTLVHRALVICSESKLQQELDSIRSILRQNDYLEVIINSTISKKIARLSKKVHKNVLFISNYPGLATFRSSSKSKSNLMLKIVFQLLNPALFSKRARFCPQFTRMLCPPRNKAWSYTNTCAAVIVGTWVAHP